MTSKYRLVTHEYFIAKNAITGAIDDHKDDHIRTTIISSSLRANIVNILVKHFKYDAQKDLITRAYHKTLEQLDEEGFL